MIRMVQGYYFFLADVWFDLKKHEFTFNTIYTVHAKVILSVKLPFMHNYDVKAFDPQFTIPFAKVEAKVV